MTNIIRRMLAAFAFALVGAGVESADANSTAPLLIPGLETFSVPRGQVVVPSLATPTPSPTPIVRSLVTAPQIARVPRPGEQTQPTPAPAESPPISAQTEPAQTKPAVPQSPPQPSPQPSSQSSPKSTLTRRSVSSSPVPRHVTAPAAQDNSVIGPLAWMALGGGIVALLAGGAWFLGRRRARDDGALAERAIGSPTGLRPALRPTQRLVPPLPATIAPRAAVEIGFRPIRAGTNLLSAAVDYELTIRNAGDAAASQVTLDVRLLSASADQDTLLASLFAAPIERARVAPFDLPPGEQRTMTGIAMLARDALTVMRAQGREFFVPVVAVNATYGWTGGAGQTANAQVIGIDRGPGAKMAPFGLSTPRMHDAVTARPHHLAVIQ